MPHDPVIELTALPELGAFRLLDVREPPEYIGELGHIPGSTIVPLRELALSYFHEYSNRRGHKTLRSYSHAFDMRRIDLEEWVTAESSCWDTHDRITDLRHYPLISKRQERLLAKRDAFNRRFVYVFAIDSSGPNDETRLVQTDKSPTHLAEHE